MLLRSRRVQRRRKVPKIVKISKDYYNLKTILLPGKKLLLIGKIQAAR
jgi:hypothetical protein